MIVFLQLLFSLSMYLLGILFLGMALTPSFYIFLKVASLTSEWGILYRAVVLALTVSLGWFVFGVTLVFLVGIFRFIFRIKLKEGVYKIFSLESLKWAFSNSLYLLINFTFINFILLTPLANLLLRMLGARLGKNIQINSRFIFDASLLEIGDNTVIGGGAVIIGHQVERGFLKLKKVKIGRNVTIGSNVIVSPGCNIGDNSIVGAGSVLLKNTKIPPRSVWHGVPAKDVKKREKDTQV